MSRLEAWRGRLTGMVLEQLRQGVEPGRLALACALGLWVGLIPTLGASTALCGVLALWLGLNQAAMQAVNFMVYPLQIVCLFPFLGLGTRVFGGPKLTLSPTAFLKMAARNPEPLVREFWKLGVHALLVWAALGLAVVPLVFLALRGLFKRLSLAQGNP